MTRTGQRRSVACMLLVLLALAPAHPNITARRFLASLIVSSAWAETNIHFHAQEGQKQKLEAELRAGVTVDALDGKGRTALMYAAANGRDEVRSSWARARTSTRRATTPPCSRLLSRRTTTRSWTC